jgi:hypothetical protein
MKRDREVDGQGRLNLIASDLFFGLGAVILVTVAALSLTLQDVVARAMTDGRALPEDTRRAAAELSLAISRPILFADAEGLHRLAAGRRTTLALDDLWGAPELAGWLEGPPLLVIAPQGQDAAFLTFSRAAGLATAPLPTLRLTQDCRVLLPQAEGLECQP